MVPELAWARATLAKGTRASNREAGSDSVARKDHTSKPKTEPARWYTIRKRDSLASIARRQLRDHRRWREIAELNELPNANRILPGTRIKLPPVVGEEGDMAT